MSGVPYDLQHGQRPSGDKAGKRARVDPFMGRVFNGRYRVIGRLAITAMSRVYQGRDDETGERVAIKVLVTRDARSEMIPQYRERFLREAAALARLSHPYIVRVLDHGIEGKLPYLVMEFLDGGTLRTLLRSSKPPPSAALRMMEHLTHALGAAHARGIVHRDIKPSNLFVTGCFDGTGPLTVRLIDFGIAKDLQDGSDITGHDTVLGTPWYMAPEQTLGDPVDARTDVYAIGCLLYRLLMGRTPFADCRGAGVLMAHISKSPPPFAEIKPDHGLPNVIEWTVRRCLEKKPNARFASMEELRNAIQICRLALDDPSFDVRLTLSNGHVVASQALIDRLDPAGAVTADPVEPSVVTVSFSARDALMLLGFVAVAATFGGVVAWVLWMGLAS